jgi:hypothetical protein
MLRLTNGVGRREFNKILVMEKPDCVYYCGGVNVCYRCCYCKYLGADLKRKGKYKGGNEMKKLSLTLILVLALWSPSFAADVLVMPLGGPNFGGMVTDLIPGVDDTYDIGEGVTPLEWKDIWIDGTAHADTIDADSVDITTITDGNIPYMQAAAAGFGDSPLSTDGTDLTSTGVYNGTTVTLSASATPGITFKDSDGTDSDDNGIIYGNLTDAGSGTEDFDLYLRQQIAGTLTTFLHADADGSLDFQDRDLVTTGNLAGATYGSDATISDADLLSIDDGATTTIAVGGGVGSPIAWTTATGTGAPVRADSPTLTTAASLTSGNLTLGNGNLVSNTVGKGVDFTVSAVSGRIASIEIAAAGTGYAAGTLSATGGGGSGFAGTYTVNGGVIENTVITVTGSGYTSAPTIVISDAGNSDAVITANPALTTSKVLPYYEEGTWTPIYEGHTGTPGAIAYSAQTGFYTRIGRLVFVQGLITLTNNGDWTGLARIAGLPFSSANVDAIGSIYTANVTYDGQLVLDMSSGANYVWIGVNKTATVTGNLDTTGVADNTSMYFSITYTTN